MNLRRPLFVLVLSLLAGHAAAEPMSAARHGLFPVPANRIVGLWHVTATTAPCAGGPTRTFLALHQFHAGGTMIDTSTVPFTPTARGPGEGIWQYQGRGQYKVRFQFARFLPDGAFDGLQDVRNTATLNAAGTQYSTTSYARVLNPDGSLRSENCGGANAQRIAID